MKIIKETEILHDEKNWINQESSSVKMNKANPSEYKYFAFWLGYYWSGVKFKETPLHIGGHKRKNLLEVKS